MNPLEAEPSKFRIILRLLVAWFFAVFLSAPLLYLYKFKYVADPGYGIKPYCTTHNPDFIKMIQLDDGFIRKIIYHGRRYFSSMMDFYNVLTLLYQYLIPLTYLGFAYTRMSIKIWYNKAPSNSNNQKDVLLAKKRTVKIMVSIFVLFFICWLPWHVKCLLQLVWKDFSQ